MWGAGGAVVRQCKCADVPVSDRISKSTSLLLLADPLVIRMSPGIVQPCRSPEELLNVFWLECNVIRSHPVILCYPVASLDDYSPMFHIRFVLDELKHVAKNNEQRIKEYVYFMCFYYPY